MIKELKKVKDIFNELNIDPTNFTCSDDADNIFFDQENYEIRYGASKFVIIPDHEDFIIKFPFHRSFEEHEEYDEETDEYDNWYDYSNFSNAFYPVSKCFGWDYCRSEQEYYETAEKEGVNYFFAPTIFIGTIHKVPIYLQEKSKPFYEGNKNFLISKEERENSRRIMKENGFYSSIGAYDSMFAHALRYTNKNECLKLVKFLKKYNIGDIRADNYGTSTIDGRFVLFDYSGYRE